MAIFITGAAGFIGYHVATSLLKKGEEVIGCDSLNDYYDVKLKQNRLSKLKKHKNFSFFHTDICDLTALKEIADENKNKITKVLHLAAYAGVRYSFKNPTPYAETNLGGFFNVLEICRNLPKLKHFIYASSSSVYGNDAPTPFSLDYAADKPVSFYGATKRSGELMAYSYSHLYGIPSTGLRFFTVYGPYGRPDMAYFSFTKAIFEKKLITVFDKGNLKRDFTYIDDIVSGIEACINKKNPSAHSLYNLGNNRSEYVKNVISIIEKSAGKKATIEFKPAPESEVKETWADIEKSRIDLGFKPKTSIQEGLPKFVEWYRSYYKI